MGMLIRACDHSHQDALVYRGEQWLGTISGGFRFGELTQAARAEIARVYGKDVQVFPGRFTLDTPDHDDTDPGML